MINKYGTCVLKIGGSQYPDVNAVYKIGEVVQSLSEQYQIKAIVVSAMGKTTSELDATAHSITKKLPNKCALDGYLATGEIQSAALLAMHLDDIGIPAHYYDAKSFGILTDENFGKATIQKITMPYVCPLNGIPVVAGFQGVTKYGDFTTLGREGSDITAVWVATVLAAGCCWFFKNGGGIYDKAPNGGSDAKLFREISYTKMLDILRENRDHSQVLHRRSVQYARKFNMPLFVSSLDNPSVGTLIAARLHSKVY